MSPGPGNALLQNGNDIMNMSGGYGNRKKSNMPTITKNLELSGPNNYGRFGDAKAEEENLELVPCRWSNTGWKYVQKPTAKTKFFTSPNRVNSHGFAATGQVVHQNTAGRQSNKDASNFVTSYGDQFNPKK